MTSYSIDDSGSNGNNDQQPDAGETIALPIILTNSGNTTASNVTATLSWSAKSYQTQSGSNATITIGTISSNFGNIAASGGTGNNNSSPFVFTINKDAFEISITPRPLTQFINFTLSIFVNGVAFSSKSFELQIAEPNLVKGENAVTGILAANTLNHQLTIKLYNNGLSTATGLTATLTTNNPLNITITDGTNIPYANIDGVNTATNSGINTSTFNFDIGSSNYSNETFNLIVTNQYGKTWTFNNFNLTIPVINAGSTINHNGYETSIELFWTLSTSATVKRYNLYRSLDNLTYTSTPINTNLINYSTYLDQGLQPFTTYYYKLTVVDMNGNESDYFPAAGYPASTSLNLHNGWPIVPTNLMGNRAEGSPNVYDV
ncbi:MAG: hypothetical protein COX07_02755, partial [Bacteroidetes bacterium CG23_combo_of_CG06-09_8_20_14_all_32_9]